MVLVRDVGIDEKQYEKATGDLAHERLQDAAKCAEAEGVKATLRHVYDEHPAEAIIDTAERESCDLIYMASHGRRGLEALMLGSETRKVLSGTKLPVLVCR